jgi:hypothetical protein
MRGLAGEGSLKTLLVGASLIVVSLTGVHPLAAEEVAADRVQETAAAASTDDYYTRRAKTVIDAEKNAGGQQHPLAASYPNMDVVVCEAGCPAHGGPEIVYAQPHPAAAIAEREGVMVPTSSNDEMPVAIDATDAVCVAGCYGRTATAEPRPSPAAGSWSTIVEQMAVPVESEISGSARPPVRDPLSPIR